MSINIKPKLLEFWRWLKITFWRRQTIYTLVLIAILIIFIFQLSIIPANSSSQEVATMQQTQNFSDIGSNPIYLPYKLTSFVINQLSDSIRALRALSVVFFGLTTIGLYRTLKRWHSDRTALLSSAMFATNATVLAVGRLATPLVLLFGWSLIITLLMWLQHGKSKRVAPIMLAGSSAILLYVPGALYFFVLLFVIFGNKTKKTLKKITKGAMIASIVGFLLVLAPLVIPFIQDGELFKQWLLLPSRIDWGTVPKDILRVPSAFIYRSPINPIIGVGRLPIFDIASGGLFFIGLYSYQKHMKLERTRIMIISTLFSIIIGALGQVTIAVILLLPFVYAVINSGICYLLDLWYSVFPRNPFARSFGFMFIALIVLISIFYQLTRFFVVWPQTPSVRNVYNQSRLIQ